MTAFFLLSGFSLYLNYQSVNLLNLKHMNRFLVKRALGLLPMYYISSIVFILFLGNETPFQNLVLLPIEALALQSVFSSLFSITHNGGTWFISCIMLCYIVYPFIQEIVLQLSIKGKIFVISLLSFILLYAPLVVPVFNLNNVYSNPFFRILEFSIGVILCSMHKDFTEHPVVARYVFSWKTVILSTLLFYAGVAYLVKFEIRIGDYMFYNLICLPCFSLILLALSGIESSTLSQSRILKYLSDLSYTFFLAQLFSNFICKKIIAIFSIIGNLEKIVLGWTICIIIALILHELVEKRLVRRFSNKLLQKFS